jgi:hypothetical protein
LNLLPILGTFEKEDEDTKVGEDVEGAKKS